MLDSNPQSPLYLRARTRFRNRQVWTPMLANTALALDEAALNSLYLDTIESPIIIADEVMAVKEYERDQNFQVSMQQATLGIQEVLDGFGFVQSKLADLYALWQIKDRIVAIKIKNTYDIITETNYLLTVELAGVTLQLTAMENDLTALAYDKTQSQAELLAEAALKQQLIAAREGLQNEEAVSREQISTLRMQMELLVNAARQWVFLNRTHGATNLGYFTEYIGKL